MYIAKHASFINIRSTEGKSYVFYMDIRAGGKRMRNLSEEQLKDDGVNYVRGRVSELPKRMEN